MNIQTEILPDHHAKLTVEVEPVELETYQKRAARKIAQNTRIPGFRPGKAPYNMILRAVGAQAVMEEAVELWVDENYSKVLDDTEVEAGAPGRILELPSFDPLTIVFLVPLEPTVKLGDYQAIRAEFNSPETTNSEVDEVIQRIQFNMATAEPVERPAENGDLVYYQISGTLTNPIDEEEPEVYPQRNVQTIIGGSSMDPDDWPFEGFSSQLAGMSSGDEKTFTHTFPAEEEDDKLQGREVQFTIKVESIKSLTLPEVNDELAQSMGDFDTLDALKTDVRQRLESTARDQYESDYFDGLLDRVVEEAEIHYPDEILDEEVEHVLEHLQGDLARQNMDLDTYLKLINTERETFIENEVKPAARKRIERSLVISELGRQENISLAESDMDIVAGEASYELQRLIPAGKKNRPNQDIIQAVTMNAMSRVRNRRILERLKAIANEETPVEEIENDETQPVSKSEQSTEPEPVMEPKALEKNESADRPEADEKA